MDLLFQRYASPFLLLNEMIASCRMLEFVDKVLKIKNDENESDTLWQFFLHKVVDKSYAEFLRESRTPQIQHQEVSMDFETTIKKSANMLIGFIPE